MKCSLKFNAYFSRVLRQVLKFLRQKIDEGILQLYKDMKINLEALYDGDEPFGETKEDVDPDDIPETLGK